MSSSVTPQRRRRSIEDVDGDDDVSVDGEAPLDASTPKRRRLHHGTQLHDIEDDEDEDEEGSATSEAPLLPDNYRRSPKDKGKSKGSAGVAHASGKHQPGSIVRVKLTNFVTYTQAEFHPGPHLNMIIGPNGTGKSTLVCAIALGLGSPPSILGRAKQIGEFVKHGAKKAEIEIELAADPARQSVNPVITTKIVRDGSKPDFLVNGKKATKKELDKLMRSFSIQVDNLCQFLPQDRVVEFAALNPIALLMETERAAAPQQMVDWHEELKEMRAEQKERFAQQKQLTDHLENMTNRQTAQEADVVRLRRRAEYQERITALEKLRPFPEYAVASRNYHAANERKREARRELARLTERTQPNLAAEQNKQAYLFQVKDAEAARCKMVQRTEQLVTTHEKKHTEATKMVDDCIQELEGEVTSNREIRRDIPRLQGNVKHIQNALQNAPAPTDFAAINNDIREKISQVREATDRQEELRERIGSLTQHMTQQNQVVERAEQEKQHSQTQAGQLANKLRAFSQPTHTAWEWVKANRHHFQSDVYGPPILECTVHNPHHANAVENVIGAGELAAITTTCVEDFKMLQHQLYKNMRLPGINVRCATKPVDYFRPPCTPEQLRSVGLESYILDLIEGPEPVLAMLCDNRNAHATAFTTRPLAAEHINALKKPNSPITSWVTPTETYQISRRREYGDKASSTRVQPLKPAKVFLDAPASHVEDAGLARRITDAKQAIDEYKAQRDELGSEYKELTLRITQLRAEENEVRQDKKAKQSRQTEFAGLPARLEQAKRKYDDAVMKISSSREKQAEISDKGDKLALDKGQHALNFANAIDAHRQQHVLYMEAQILVIEATSDYEQLQARTTAERATLEERQREVTQLEREAAALKKLGEKIQEKCLRIGNELNDDETTGLRKVYDEVKAWEPDQLETEIQSVQARLDMEDGGGGGGNQHVLREYEQRAAKIENRREQLRAVEDDLQELDGKIKEVRDLWEPRLDRLVEQISEAFAENFSKIQCAGEVRVHKDEDFEAWCVQIWVRFRESEPLSLLDSHRQSGGERAVSTIFYLMALQSLARAPFRVVDEINQGMDPRNERMVHGRMVEIACEPKARAVSSNDGDEEQAESGGGSQYFLITPKLLNGLRYHERMRVHCIASGEYMPAEGRGLDFSVLAARALAVKAGAATA